MKPLATNRLLDTLSLSESASMLDATELVTLPLRFVLYEPGIRPKYAYFITDGIASVVLNGANGQIAEVGIIGREGITGALHLLGPLPIPTQCFMQIAGSGRRLLLTDLEVLFRNSPPLNARLLEFLQMVAINAHQLASCNALHSLDERLARWLLVVQDRLKEMVYYLTHEFLAEMLVVQRPTLSIAAASLQRQGIIHYHHGQLRILDRVRLEAKACECYAISQGLLHSLYSSYKPHLERLNGQKAKATNPDAS